MKMLNDQQVRDLVIEFWNNNKDKKKIFTVKHFVSMGIGRRTVYKIIQTFEECGTTKRLTGQGRPVKKITAKVMKQIERQMVDQIGKSARKTAKKHSIPEITLRYHLKKEGIRVFKRKKVPHYSAEQATKAQQNCLKLAKEISGKIVVMDDESYFPLKADYIPGNDIFYTKDKQKTPDHVKFAAQSKFPERLMVWIAVSEKGVSEPFYKPRNCAIDANLYQNECIKKKLVQFLNRFHQNDKIIFWPDLAACHYAKSTIALLNELEIPVVEKKINPPNVPQCRPIEKFWFTLKCAVYENGWEAQNEMTLKQRITRKIHEMDITSLQNDLKGLGKKLRKTGRFGVYATI